MLLWSPSPPVRNCYLRSVFLSVCVPTTPYSAPPSMLTWSNQVHLFVIWWSAGSFLYWDLPLILHLSVEPAAIQITPPISQSAYLLFPWWFLLCLILCTEIWRVSLGEKNSVQVSCGEEPVPMWFQCYSPASCLLHVYSWSYLNNCYFNKVLFTSCWNLLSRWFDEGFLFSFLSKGFDADYRSKCCCFGCYCLCNSSTCVVCSKREKKEVMAVHWWP